MSDNTSGSGGSGGSGFVGFSVDHPVIPDELRADVARLLDRATIADAYIDALKERLDTLEAENKALRDCIETAWGIIANAGGGNWNTQTPEWREAAESWRDKQFHPIMKDVSALRANVEEGKRDET